MDSVAPGPLWEARACPDVRENSSSVPLCAHFCIPPAGSSLGLRQDREAELHPVDFTVLSANPGVGDSPARGACGQSEVPACPRLPFAE